jgi:predicted MFS family arabinose efflux permease
MGTADLGLWLGLIFGTSGFVGILAGGFIAARWFGEDERAQMRMSAILNALLVPCFLVFLLAPQREVALLALLPLGMTFVFVNGPTFALMQRLVPENARATAIAVVMLMANLFGMGLGPQIVGVLSDLLAPMAGAESLRYAMLSISIIALWAAYHFWQAGKSVQADLLVPALSYS